jgi:hypothetical protein
VSICSACGGGRRLRPFKSIETRSWPAPKALIGQTLAIHAAKRPIDNDGVHVLNGDEWPVAVPQLPLGAVVGTAVLTDCIPMLDDSDYRYGRHDLPRGAIVIGDGHSPSHPLLGRCGYNHPPVDVSDQLPFGDFTPGRWAWLFTDARPVDPIPCPGRGRLWDVPDDIAERLT